MKQILKLVTANQCKPVNYLHNLIGIITGWNFIKCLLVQIKNTVLTALLVCIWMEDVADVITSFKANVY